MMSPVVAALSAGRIASVASLSVANIAAPTELNSRVGSAGEWVLCYQTAAGGTDTWTLYAFDVAGSSVSSPFRLAASGSGYWVAIGSRYNNSAVSLNSTLGVAGILSVTDTTEASAVGTASQTTAGGLGVTKRSFLGTIGSTFKGNVVAGVQDGTVAVAGQVGEVLSSAQSTYTNFTATATYQQLGTLALTAGDWEVLATVTFSNNGSTMTAASSAIAVIATATAAATGAVEGQTIDYASQTTLAVANAKETRHLAVQIAVAATTNYYLNAQATFTVGNPQYVSLLRARRLR